MIYHEELRIFDDEENTIIQNDDSITSEKINVWSDVTVNESGFFITTWLANHDHDWQEEVSIMCIDFETLQAVMDKWYNKV
jgi:hypothetical protein